MYFQHLAVHNFMSYQSQEFRDFDKPGLVLIEGRNLDEGGSNGAGKSAIWDGISWGLFGKTVRGIANDDVINREVGKDCSVHVTIKQGKEEFVVQRCRKHNLLGNRLLVDYRDESGKVQKVEHGTIADTQEWLLNKLGIDFDLFRCTIVFSQGDTFNFVDATNKEQKEILSKIMRVDFDALLAKAKSKTEELIHERDKYASEILILQSHRVENPEKLYETEIAEWSTKQQEKERQFVKEIAELRQERGDAFKKMKDGKKLDKILSQLETILSELRSKTKEAMEKRAELCASLGHNKKEIERASKLGAGKCPFCYQPINEFMVMKQIDESKGNITTLQVLKESADQRLKTYEDQTEEYRKKTEKVRELRIRQEQLSEQYVRDTKRENKLVEDLSALRKEKNPYQDRRDEEIERQHKIAIKLKQWAERRDEMIEALAYYEFWETAFGDAGIKSFVFDLICSTLTEKSNRYGNVLTGGLVTLQFDTQTKLKSGNIKEKFEAAVITNGKVVPYAAYSGAEKTTISLSVDMALSDIMTDNYKSNFNIAVFDERNPYSDTLRRERFMDLIRDMAKTKRVFVVEHDSEFKSLFDETITIEKKSGVSRVC